MLYSFKDHVAEMREEGNEALLNYEEKVEDLSNVSNLEDTVIYKSYLSKFDVKELLDSIPLAVPEDYESDFDYNLLTTLVCASLSSVYDFSLTPDLNSFRLGISVKSGDQKVHKYIDGLWFFQILHLFEIYIKEQMELFVLALESDGERKMLKMERDLVVKKFRLAADCLINEKVNKAFLCEV